MKPLIARLRLLRPRPPSRRVKEWLFGPSAERSAGAGWLQAALPLGATAVCSFMLALWTGRDFPGPADAWAVEIRPAADATLAPSDVDSHTVWNAAPARLEWTNKGPSLSSMPSLPQGVTNRLR